MGIEVRRFTWDCLDSNMYVIKFGTSALIIDPVYLEEAFVDLRNIEKMTVLLTHEHYDHICGLNRLRREHSCTVIAQKECSLRIQDCKLNLSEYAEVLLSLAERPHNCVIIPFSAEKADVEFETEYHFEWENQNIELVSTPGHSPGSICIRIGDKLFSGDSLLPTGPMNRFPGGSNRVYKEQAMPKILRLLGKVEVVYPGHGEIQNADLFYEQFV